MKTHDTASCPPSSVQELRSSPLSDHARLALATLATQASPADRPGDWCDRGIIARFGSDAVSELVDAGLVQRGGVPDPLPAEIETSCRATMVRHYEICAREEGFGRPLYPAGGDIVLVTRAGWATLALLGDEQPLDDPARLMEAPASGADQHADKNADDAALNDYRSCLSSPWDKSAGPPVDLNYAEPGHGRGFLAPDDPLQHRYILGSTAEAGRLIGTIAKGDRHG
ncbi:hypothetical protein [Acidiphilium acidophilum]|uniref:Uncharacterized protein n=1 Tax=Acidiphilium acidophilum TaxID=76588 RepID=A0AAW9DLU3_ACIAO|nr:hypothetical protein [Acidiphilium acidophilum]MDX5929195.1 hypothetical protein [Acidiphilium acidophilum]